MKKILLVVILSLFVCGGCKSFSDYAAKHPNYQQEWQAIGQSTANQINYQNTRNQLNDIQNQLNTIRSNQNR